MLDLETATLVGRGLHRLCYVHPANARLCIKVLLTSESGGPLIEARREVDYYRLLQRRGVPWTMLPAFHGQVATSRGTGYVFDLIRDCDGSVAGSLDQYLSRPEATADLARALPRTFEALRQYLLRWKIITMTLKAKNILYQRIVPEEGRLVIVDGVGSSEFIPVCRHIGLLARWKMRRRWRRFEASLAKEYPQHPLVGVPDGR